MSSSAAAQHLLGVWNPSYESDAMDAHIDILLRHARAAQSDDVYVWWGKLRSQYRQAPLPHLGEILAIDRVLADGDADVERHLYLTDFRSLYVAHLGAITDVDVRQDAREVPHIPAYYLDASVNADCWFQLWDIRRLVLEDTTAVTQELRALRNTRYNDQRVSLYGGMVDLPLIVTRRDAATWFDDTVKAQFTEGRHWVEFDAERAGTGEMQRELRDNRFGVRLWGNLDPAARGFIASAEQLFRTHRNDAGFDLSTVIIDFAKAVELQLNRVVRLALADADPAVRTSTLADGRSVDLCGRGVWGLGDLTRAIANDRNRNLWFARRLEHGEWFAASLPSVLEELRKVRNPASHGAVVERARVEQLRASLIGVGCKGSLIDLAQVRMRAS